LVMILVSSYHDSAPKSLIVINPLFLSLNRRRSAVANYIRGGTRLSHIDLIG
jgi:hypothetical protein